MKITDLKCALIGTHPTIRIATDAGISGYGQAERAKTYLKPHVLHYRQFLIGEDPRDVERIMIKIRRLGASKPWGSAVSAIEMALWDLAGKAAGLPIHRLLGGKVRDRVRVYLTGTRSHYGASDMSPEAFADRVRSALTDPGGFSIVKQGIGFHSKMPDEVPDFFFGDPRSGPPHPSRGLLTEQGFNHVLGCVEAMVDEIGDRAALALDCGPGWTVPDAIRLGRALERFGNRIIWMEDLLSGDYTPSSTAAEYREVTRATTTPTHTGEQLYLRHGFRELIEQRAVRVIGPDPLDIGGLAELKWVAEYSDLHGILMAPHGTGDGILGMAGLVQAAATLPDNYIAFELPVRESEWWADIVEGLPDPLVVDGHIAVWDRPGLGVDLLPEKACAYLDKADADFFD